MINKKRFFIVYSILTILTIILVFGRCEILKGETPLKLKYKKWLNLVEYIITPIERKIFSKITNDRDRDSFMKIFWNHRDPTNGTPENEFKENHIKRFNYANKYFKYGTPKPGWRTDRGKIYIILGAPMERNIIDQNGLYPIEIWEYFGKKKKQLPVAFRIVFYKKHGFGEYKLYSPVIDGPASLMHTEIGQIDETNYIQLYNKLNELNTTVANASISLIPGKTPYNYQPSLESNLLLAKIFEYPIRNINISYARDFMKFKGMVDVSSSINYIESQNDVYIFKEPILNLNFIHIIILPKKISVDYSEEKNKYYLNYELTVSLKKDDCTVYQNSKNFPFYYSEKELKTELSRGLAITDYFPIIEGKFELNVLIQNSVNREFSYFQKKIDTNDSFSSLPHLYSPVIASKIEKLKQHVFSSFNTSNYKIYTSPKREFGLKDDIYIFFCVDRGEYNKKILCRAYIKSKESYKKYSKQYSFILPEKERYMCFTKKLDKLESAYYELNLVLSGEEDRIIYSAKKKDFTVSPASHLAYPMVAKRTILGKNSFIFYYILAKEYENSKNYDKALYNYKKAYNLKQSFPELIKDYANFLLKVKKYNEVFKIIDGLKNREKELFYFYLYKGRAYYYTKNYRKAVEHLYKANNIYDSDISVLNCLGLSFIKLNKIKKAIEVLSASLIIRPDQKQIIEILQSIKKD